MSDLQFMGLVTVVAAVVVGGLGMFLVHRARRWSLVAALVVAALVPFAAVVTAVAVNVDQMFLSSHDADVIWFVLGVSSLLALVLAVILGRAVGHELRRVADDARALARSAAGTSSGTGTGGKDAGAKERAPLTAELAHLAAELAETRDNLAAARAAERAAEDSRRQVVAFVSHDLRSPLAGIHAASQGLRDGVFADTDAALDGIESAVQRMARMIDDLTELSRPDATAPAPASTGGFTQVDLAAVVRDVVAHVLPVATDAGVELVADVAPDVRVTGDAGDLGRLLDNLVSNAVRSSDAGGRVRVAVSRVEGAARLVVEDTCGGIPAHELALAREPGFQGAGERVGSSGLGLAIVDQVVEDHAGRVEIGSTGVGCSVEVRIPALEG
ncbi:signal transduction histidine kinase [Sediminihabitans luteus]|uniref:Sensor-like histidine kinase SenX3 n=1 Tax=Sediminihabitans luteus TaxID=1138585 RepID=A0A2M9CER8_9CELL|nr:HAMP domain-containing sensor histidine kinase [Sediminihabitans luteus]PJJ70379.1 signal transduction histidine kinase [Sediminihabitans luteus]GII97851.1 two-component sensor histidine kinase [Sediminihabitans luteus]